MIRIIHCADLHLDSPMETHMTNEQASTRNTEIIHSFLRLTNYAAENDVRVVIIAGDMFDGNRVKTRTVDEVLDAMRRTPKVDYLYLAGNHDNVVDPFMDRDVPKNFKKYDRQWRTYEYEGVAISGIEIYNDNASSLYDNVPHIVTMHGQVSSTVGVDQVNITLLRNRGIDYLALGHIHTYSVQPLDNKGIYCYSGCLEGRGFDECGPKGFVLVTIEEGRVQHEFIHFSCRQLHQIPVDISGMIKNSEIAQKMMCAAQEISSNDMVEFRLCGAVDPTANIAVSYLQNLIKGNYFFTKVKDETHMVINLEDYKNDISLKGEFIRLVLSSDVSEEDKAAMIRTGMQALTGEEITL